MDDWIGKASEISGFTSPVKNGFGLMISLNNFLNFELCIINFAYFSLGHPV